MDIEAAELHDWEVLLPNPVSAYSGLVDSAENPNAFEEIGAHSEGIVHANYFSLDPGERYIGTVSDVLVGEAGSEASDSPSWIDPGLDTGYPRKESAESWPDSGSDRSDDRKFEGKGEMCIDGIEEIGEENVETFLSDTGGIEISGLKMEQFEETMEDPGVEGDVHISAEKKENEAESIGTNKADETLETGPCKSDEVKKRSVVWWKVPYELLRYCVFRAGPAWNFSVAAAVMGFVIFSHRLYKMKKKTRSLELKVTMDDKKASQFISRVARLNEAFSVVKRFPVIRPQLPAAGVIPWPVMAALI